MNDSAANEMDDWRLSIARTWVGREISITMGVATVEALYFQSDAMPMQNPSASIEAILLDTWRMLEAAASTFTRSEWQLLMSFESPLDQPHDLKCNAAAVARDFIERFPGSHWNGNVLALKILMKKVAQLSQVEFAAVLTIVKILRNLGGEERLQTLASRLPALLNETV
ncbi:hypothetical protein [Phreatobacter sp.]|uniref:hypothetical protein n=1 Tax=Phreatobacter sp. TaxID=1966341 RepID=UPI003F6EE72D